MFAIVLGVSVWFHWNVAATNSAGDVCGVDAGAPVVCRYGGAPESLDIPPGCTSVRPRGVAISGTVAGVADCDGERIGIVWAALPDGTRLPGAVVARPIVAVSDSGLFAMDPIVDTGGWGTYPLWGAVGVTNSGWIYGGDPRPSWAHWVGATGAAPAPAAPTDAEPRWLCVGASEAFVGNAPIAAAVQGVYGHVWGWTPGGGYIDFGDGFGRGMLEGRDGFRIFGEAGRIPHNVGAVWYFDGRAADVFPESARIVAGRGNWTVHALRAGGFELRNSLDGWDCNGDGAVNNFDIDAFVVGLVSGRACANGLIPDNSMIADFVAAIGGAASE